VKNVTIKDVAKVANVSIATVSRVLNCPEKVSKEKVERVKWAINKLRYQPNFFAGKIKKNIVNDMIAFVYPSDNEHIVNNPFYSKIFKSFDQELQSRCMSMVFIGQNQVPDSQKLLFNLINDGRICGIVFLSFSGEKVDEYINIGDKIPVILIDPFFWHQGENLIVADNYGGGMIAAEFLVEMGHKRILFLTGSYYGKISWSFKERFRGVSDWLDRRCLTSNLNCLEYVIEIGDSKLSIEEAAYETVLDLLCKDFNYDVIFGASDRIAIGAVKALKDRGLRVPEDIGVIGFEGIDLAKNFSPPLTTVEVNTEMMGTLGVKRLCELIGDDSKVFDKYTIVTPTKLVIGESC